MSCNRCRECENNGCIKLVSPRCILTGEAYACLGVNAGATLADVFDAIEELCTEISSGSATCSKFKVVGSDTCCQYLDGSITSDSLDISVTSNPGGTCSTLHIDEQTRIWTDFGSLSGGWTSIPTVTGTLQFGVRNDEVRFKGGVQHSTDTYPGDVVMVTLPVAARPSEPKVFVQVYGKDPNAGAPVIWLIGVATNGDVHLSASSNLQIGDNYDAALFFDVITYTK
jgi:hypothetical protein